ncbi:MAG: hypothetical protein [Cotesia congregata filamentous virus 2]
MYPPLNIYVSDYNNSSIRYILIENFNLLFINLSDVLFCLIEKVNNEKFLTIPFGTEENINKILSLYSNTEYFITTSNNNGIPLFFINISQQIYVLSLMNLNPNLIKYSYPLERPLKNIQHEIIFIVNLLVYKLNIVKI